MKYLQCLIALFVAQLVVLAVVPLALATEHIVTVSDHRFTPDQLTIQAGDTVKWVWQDSAHNVVAREGAFSSELQAAGTNFSITFSDSFLDSNLVAQDTYEYVCTPHEAMGMVGSIKVQRQNYALRSTLSHWEVVGASASAESASCSLSLNGNTRALSTTCIHSDQPGTQIALRLGGLSENGATLCDLSPTSGLSSTCILSQDNVSALVDGGTYIQLNTTAQPSGSLRGQVVLAAGTYRVSGKVSLSNGAGLAGSEVRIGTLTTSTDESGAFILNGVPNGAYQITASKSGYSISPRENISPFLVNGDHRFQRLMLAEPTSQPACAGTTPYTTQRAAPSDIDGDCSSDLLTQIKGKSSARLKRYVDGTEGILLETGPVLKLGLSYSLGDSKADLTSIAKGVAKLIWNSTDSGSGLASAVEFADKAAFGLLGCYFDSDAVSDKAAIKGKVLQVVRSADSSTLEVKLPAPKGLRKYNCGDFDGDGFDELYFSEETKAKGKLSTRISVIDLQGKIVNKRTIASGIQGLASGDQNNDGLLEPGYYRVVGKKSEIVLFSKSAKKRFAIGTTLEAVVPAVIKGSGNQRDAGLFYKLSNGQFYSLVISSGVSTSLSLTMKKEKLLTP